MSQAAVVDPYWSRTAPHGESVGREDPVVWGRGAGSALSGEEVTAYERDGFHHASDLFSEMT